MKKYIVTMVFVLAGIAGVYAQDAQADYIKTLTDRSNKIVTNVGVTDSAKFYKVRDIVINQYKSLGTIHDGRNAQAKAIKDAAGDDKAGANAKVAALDSVTNKQLTSLHQDYLKKLGKYLTADQVTKVKDEMTYKLVDVTYNAYCDELPDLKDDQKAQIKAWLIEARELAIDAESSNKKHEVFGKYKGRINNYLSKAGYDMKKAGEEWQKRIKERQAAKAPSNG